MHFQVGLALLYLCHYDMPDDGLWGKIDTELTEDGEKKPSGKFAATEYKQIYLSII